VASLFVYKKSRTWWLPVVRSTCQADQIKLELLNAVRKEVELRLYTFTLGTT